tara:strand:+ start:2155 stop:4587 length:2433 start_codon:yes stop_codon:yes gene_type:complete
MTKLKITIVTYSWPPRNSISTHRPYSWARYWSEKGHDITILTAKKQSFDLPLDLELPKLKGVNVIEMPYPSFFGSWFLKFSSIEKIAKLIRFKFANFLGKDNDPRNNWFLTSSPIFSKIARDTDVVISTYGPEVAHVIGCRMKMLCPSIYWIADYRDLWSDNPNFVTISKKLKEKIRKKEKETVGRYADLITSVSDDICMRLNKLHKKPVIKITNGFDIFDKIVKKNISRKKHVLSKPLKIVYTGTIYSKELSPVMLLDAIVNLVNKKKIPKKSIIIEFYGSRLDHIKKLSQKSKYSNLISIKGHIPRLQVLEKQKNADLLLILARSKEISRGDVSGKIFEYMSAGRPIICIGSRSDFEIGKVLKMTNMGLVFEKHQIKKLENFIYNHYSGEGLFKNFKPNINKVLTFSRKRIAHKFIQKIKEIFSDRKKSEMIKFIKPKKHNKKIPSVIHLITGLERGGAERFLYNLVSNGLKGQFNNSVISLMTDGYYGNLLKKKNIPVFSLNMERGKINFLAAKKIRKILLDQKPDIIQGWMYHGNLAALLGYVMIGRNVKLSWNIRLSLEIYKRMKLTTRLAIKLGSHLSRIPNLIIYNSYRSLEQHRTIGYNKVSDFSIPNGFDIKVWKPNKKVGLNLRNKLGISNTAKVVGYVGRGDDQKDIPTLFKAFDIVCKKYSNVILLTVGRNLKQYSTSNKNIIFLGQQSNVEDLMKTFDLLCLSSKAEGFPNVIGEAMSTGIPCVTTDVGDAKDIVGNTGWVSPPNDPIALAKCLDSALKKSRRELNEHGKISRKKIVNNFSIDRVKNQYISLYNSIL